jgi:hypothetical protein
MDISLPNNCSISEFKVIPSNWDKAGAKWAGILWIAWRKY